jgi:predicted ATPase
LFEGLVLAEIFAEAMNRGVQVVVETHSELFLLSRQLSILAPQNKSYGTPQIMASLVVDAFVARSCGDATAIHPLPI